MAQYIWGYDTHTWHNVPEPAPICKFECIPELYDRIVVKDQLYSVANVFERTRSKHPDHKDIEEIVILLNKESRE